MLNPSTADGEVDDPTIRRCVGFAKKWGYSGITVVNLFALRTTDPNDLYRVSRDNDVYPIGPDNDNAIIAGAATSDCVVCAWGAHGSYMGRGPQVIKMIGTLKSMCLGMTKGGQPKHPLYLRNDTKRQRLPELARIT